jgi:type I restriction enzyme S subunit
VSEVDLPSGWVWVTLGEVTEPVEQRGPSGCEAFRYIDIGAVDNEGKRIVGEKTIPVGDAPSRARQNVRTGDVLVSMTRPNLNAVALVPTLLDGAIASTGFCVLRSSQVEPQWLFAVVRSPGFVAAMTGLVQGALYPAVRPSDIKDYRFPLPPLAEQRRIVAKLDKVFSCSHAARAALDAVLPLLERHRQAVLAMVLSRATDDHCVTTLGEMASLVTSGSRGWAAYYSESGPLFVRSQDINTDRLSLDEIAHVDLPPHAAEGRRTRVCRDDVLVTITGANVTRAAHVDFDIPEAYVSQHVALVRLRNATIARYVHWWLLSEQHGRDQLRKAAYGSGKPGLSLQDIRAVRVVVPSQEAIAKAISAVERAWTMASLVEELLLAAERRLDDLESSALAAALRGELVPQDYTDEPADLLARARAEFTPPTRTPRRRAIGRS